MKQNIIFCDGGLANRLNTLLFGLILKNKFGGNWAISWPINNWCGSKFENLFSIEIPVYEYPLSFFKDKETDYILTMHENQINFNENNINYHRHFKILMIINFF